jgi:hypothetical protein
MAFSVLIRSVFSVLNYQKHPQSHLNTEWNIQLLLCS